MDLDKESTKNMQSSAETAEMNEEEIIIECNKLLITLKNSHIDGKIIQILYDLYEQEKEKNKELNYIKRCFDYCVEQENKKWEDKRK